MRVINFNQLGYIPKTKAEAVEMGLEYFYPDDPCKNKHISHRLVDTGECVECIRIKQIQERDTEEKRMQRKVKDGIELSLEERRLNAELAEVWDE